MAILYIVLFVLAVITLANIQNNDVDYTSIHLYYENKACKVISIKPYKNHLIRFFAQYIVTYEDINGNILKSRAEKGVNGAIMFYDISPNDEHLTLMKLISSH